MRGHVRGLLWGIDSKLSVSCLPVAPFWFEQRLLVLGEQDRVTTALLRVRCCCWPLLLLPLLVPVLTGLGINIGSGSGGAAVFRGEERLLRVAQGSVGRSTAKGKETVITSVDDDAC